MSNALILMTALLPTEGHKALIEFACSIPGVETVDVLISTRFHEPTDFWFRFQCFKEAFGPDERIFLIHHPDDNAPQNDDGTPEFWEYWKNTIARTQKKYHLVVASEPYGAKVAEVIGATFLPYDIERVLYPITGTFARKAPLTNWKKILPHARYHMKINAVLFGQESIGKTSLAKVLGVSEISNWVPEYARPYLETVGSELNDEKMHNIFLGQTAYQSTALREVGKPFTYFDTDLYSTIGYHRIQGNHDLGQKLEEYADSLRSDVYFLLPDDVPFEKDPLRYGGNVRESTYEFWRDLLEEFNLPFVEVPEGSFIDKLRFIENETKKLFLERNEHIIKFARD